MFNVLDKAHIKHFISFIKNKVFDFIKPQGSAFKMVHNASRSSDNDVYSAFKLFQLRCHSGTTVNCTQPRETSVSKRLNFAANLHGKLSGRRKNQRLRVTFVICDFLNKRKSERGCFSGSGTGFCNHVCIAFQQTRNGENLYRGRNFKTFSFYGF